MIPSVFPKNHRLLLAAVQLNSIALWGGGQCFLLKPSATRGFFETPTGDTTPWTLEKLL